MSDTTQVLFTRKGISETTHFTPAMVYEVYGFSPEQVADWKGLAGDSSDNIPGIPGVGDKTAVRLLHQYGTLDNILAHAGEVKGKLGENSSHGRIRRKCAANWRRFAATHRLRFPSRRAPCQTSGMGFPRWKS